MIKNYADNHGYTLTDDALEIILVDIHEEADISEHVTELQMRVALSIK